MAVWSFRPRPLFEPIIPPAINRNVCDPPPSAEQPPDPSIAFSGLSSPLRSLHHGPPCGFSTSQELKRFTQQVFARGLDGHQAGPQAHTRRCHSRTSMGQGLRRRLDG